MAIHLLTGAELTAGELHALIARAEQLKLNRMVAAKTAAQDGPLRGKTVALLFEQPSTRTRMSSEIAVRELGGTPLVLAGDAMQLSRGESVRDTALVMSRYVHAIGVRTGPQQTVDELAMHGSVPVINLLTQEHHPCQALADLLTLKECHGELAGKRIVYVGDGNNVATSLMVLGAKAGVSVTVATPPDLAPHPYMVQLAQSQAEQGAQIAVTSDPQAAVVGADAIYADVWVSMGDEQSDKKKKQLAPFQLNELLLAKAGPQAVAMHCLPAHVGEEIDEQALYGPRTAVFAQAENRLHVFKSLLEHLLT